MSEWRECKVADAPFDIIDGDRGTNYPKQDEFNQTGYCLFLSAKNVTADGFAFNDCFFISKERDEKLRKGKLQRNDIVLTTRGTVGNIGFFNGRVPYENIRINSGMVIIRPDRSDILPEYTYQLFKYLKGDFDVYATGSAQPQLPIRDLREISFLLPPLPEQSAIAGVLSSLDDKIDLLHRQNKTLEGLAGALWRKMFVEEADLGWKKGKLGDICTNKKVKPERSRIEDYEYYVPIDCIQSQSLALVDCEPVINANSSIITFEEGDILFGAMRPYFHKVTISPFKGLTRTTCFILKPTTQIFLEYLLFLLFQKETIDYADNSSVGSTIPYAVWDKGLSDMPILIPNEPTLIKFNKIASPIVSKIKQSFYQVKNLSRLRDTLLPKLMSGEVRVKV